MKEEEKPDFTNLLKFKVFWICEGHMPRVFSSLPCLSWTEKPVTKPKDSEVFECLAYSPAEHLPIFRGYSFCWAFLSSPSNTKRDSAAPRMSCVFYPIIWSRQKASFWLQLEKYWAPQLNIESAGHPQHLQNQCGLQTGLKNKLLPAQESMFQLFACSYFCISPSRLHYLEMPSIVTTFHTPPPFFFLQTAHYFFIRHWNPCFFLIVSIFLSKSGTYFYLSLCLYNYFYCTSNIVQRAFLSEMQENLLQSRGDVIIQPDFVISDKMLLAVQRFTALHKVIACGLWCYYLSVTAKERRQR